MNIGNYDWKTCFYVNLLPLIYSFTNKVIYKSKKKCLDLKKISNISQNNIFGSFCC